jgi:hypothetical protein
VTRDSNFDVFKITTSPNIDVAMVITLALPPASGAAKKYKLNSTLQMAASRRTG